jgi:hypothetical protein
MMHDGELWEQSTQVLRTDEIESGLWPTATAGDSKNAANRTATRHNPNSKHHSGTTLVDAVRMWPTPCARDWKGANAPEGLTRQDGKSRMDQLANAVAHPDLRFATPQARDSRTGSTERWDNPERSRNLNDQIGGQLNPTWVEWLMGWPIGWTDLKPLEMDKFQQWQQQHSEF